MTIKDYYSGSYKKCRHASLGLLSNLVRG